MMHPTMQDVAAAAGVSIKTVSRVVNDEAYVAEPTAARVRAAIERLAFRRNDMAHLLRTQRAATIGLVIEDLANPFYAMIARAAERVTRERGYVLMVSSSEKEVERERALLATFFRRRIDGLLMVPTSQDHSFLQPELDRGMPIVCLDRPADGIDVDRVLLDNYRGARLAVSHLLRRGHRRIATVGWASDVDRCRAAPGLRRGAARPWRAGGPGARRPGLLHGGRRRAGDQAVGLPGRPADRDLRRQQPVRGRCTADGRRGRRRNPGRGFRRL